MKQFITNNFSNQITQVYLTILLKNMVVIQLFCFFFTLLAIIYLNYKLENIQLLKSTTENITNIIITIWEIISNFIQICLQILKHEFIPQTIFCDCEEGIIAQVQSLHFYEDDLYNIKKIHCDNYYYDLKQAIDPTNRLGILHLTQKNTNFLSDTWFSMRNVEGEIIWRNIVNYWPSHGGLIDIKPWYVNLFHD